MNKVSKCIGRFAVTSNSNQLVFRLVLQPDCVYDTLTITHRPTITKTTHSNTQNKHDSYRQRGGVQLHRPEFV